VPTKCRSIYSSVEEVHEMPKSLSARIVVDLYPSTHFGLAGLPQCQGDVAKRTPAAGVEQVRFRGFEKISSNFHGIVFADAGRSADCCDSCKGIRVCIASTMRTMPDFVRSRRGRRPPSVLPRITRHHRPFWETAVRKPAEDR